MSGSRPASRTPRWALSFADLCLLLLGFFVMLQARPDAARLAAGMRGAFGASPRAAIERRADTLFQPGEAILRPAARAAIRAFASEARAGATVSSHGTEAGSARFDGWELAAARTAAIARELVSAGVAPGTIMIAIDPATGGGQTVLLSAR